MQTPPSPLRGSFIATLYAPWVISLLLEAAPATSYIVAWLGSFYIFYQTWFSHSRFILPDIPASKQILRPLFVQQLIFAGFMCCTSIFYFLNVAGFRYFEQLDKMDYIAVAEQLKLTAKCQRLSVLAHASLVTGILIGQDRYVKAIPRYKPAITTNFIVWIIRVGVITFLTSYLMKAIPGLSQFYIGLYNVALFCGAVVLTQGVVKKNIKYLAWGGCIFLINLLTVSLSGYKEPIIVNFVIVVFLLFPHYRKPVLAFSIPFFIALFYIAPTYSSIVREQSWSGEASAEDARSEALETIFLDDETSLEETNWNFLTNRLSEIGMFTTFVKSTPEIVPYYYTELAKNALIVIIPRLLWKEKPITEELAMERVYNADVINRLSNVSAKTRPVVDGYLSGGFIGIIIYMLFLGFISQTLCNRAESLFGGYEPGCIIFFNGFFLVLWRGETIEFLLNSLFWSFVAMVTLFLVLRLTNYMEKVQPD